MNIKTEINNSLNCLKSGGTLIYPTDTAWGLGCDPVNDKAINKIHEIKKSDKTKPMLVLMNSTAMLERYVNHIPPIAFELMEAAIHPLTIIYPEAKNISEKLMGEDGSIGVRIINDNFCLNLLKRFRRPIVSTSANISGEELPTGADDINKEILSKVDYIVDTQYNNKTNRYSDIIKLGTKGEIQIIRKQEE